MCCPGLTCEGGFYGTCKRQSSDAATGLEARVAMQSHSRLPKLRSTFSLDTAKNFSHSVAGSMSKGVPHTISNGPQAGKQVVGCVQSCYGCCLVSTTASLVQFYTGEQLTCASLQCGTSRACGQQAGGIGPCLPAPASGTDCPPANYGGITYADSIIALSVLTGVHVPMNCNNNRGPNYGCCDDDLSCPDQKWPGGRVDLCPDPSGISFWNAGLDLTQAQLDKILSSGNPVIIIYSFSSHSFTHSTLIAEKDGSLYKVWDPSPTFNPGKNWQELQFASIQSYSPPNPTFGSADWKETVWGGGVQLC